jgi:tetratricopeptide (TPR) repeat protein
MLPTGYRFGPYVIDGLLGAGGMGEVYRARDTRLDRTVAIKVLSPGLARDLEFRERFEREARAVAALNHPHVCTLYDVGADASMNYLVMEYLEGQTLAARLDEGPLALEEWVRVAGEFLSALEAAHERQVVHRDIKPANIFITDRGLAKVLDFGVSKSLVSTGASSAAATVAATGGIVGTIDYMSPEQARGRLVDARSDVFSAGIVLYEMATARHPFRGADFIETLHRTANAEPPPFDRQSRGWSEAEAIVRRCLRKVPAERYASAGVVLEDVRRLQRSLQSGSLSPSAAEATLSPFSTEALPGKRRHLAAGVIGVALLVAVVAAAWVFSTARQPGSAEPATTASPAVRARRAVGVFGFRNLSRREADAWLSTALSEMLSAELGTAPALRVVAGEHVARATSELLPGDETTLGPDTLSRVRTLLGADVVVLGSYLAVPASGGQLQVNISLQDTRAGETMATLTAKGTTDGVLQIVSELGTQLRARLGVATEATSSSAVRSRMVTNSAALRLYAEGIAHLRAQEYLLARDTLAKAVDADPGSAQLHAALAEAWSALGYDARAREEAALAADRARDLGREDRLAVQSRFHELTQQWEPAIEDYRTLFGFFPDNVDYGVSLAIVLTRAGRPAEALATVASLRQLPSPLREDVRIDLAEADAAHAVSDFSREFAAGRAAAERGLAQGARALVAQGRLAQAQARIRLGAPSDARQLLESARQLFHAAGDRSGEARALNRLANVAYEQGDYSEAKRQFQEAEKILRAVGNLRELAGVLNNVADTMMMLDELEPAERVFTDALGIAAERRDTVSEAFLRTNAGDLAYRRGRLTEAEASGRKGLELARGIGNPYAIYMALLALGNVALARNDLSTAAARYEEGLELARRTNDRRYTAYLLAALGNVAAAGDQVEEARRHHRDALEIRRALGGRAEVAESDIALALLAIRAPPRDEPAGLDRAIEDVNRLRLSSPECLARSVKAVLLGGAGRTGDALRESQAAHLLLPKVQTVPWRLAIRILLARADAMAGQRARAATTLRSVAADARRLGFVQLERDAARTLAEITAGSAERTGGTAS